MRKYTIDAHIVYFRQPRQHITTGGPPSQSSNAATYIILPQIAPPVCQESLTIPAGKLDTCAVSPRVQEITTDAEIHDTHHRVFLHPWSSPRRLQVAHAIHSPTATAT
jgi:hypothetical protein